MADDTMKQYMERLARERDSGAVAANAAALGYGAAAGAGVYSMHPAGLAAALPLGGLSYFMRQLALGARKDAEQARTGATAWGNTGLPEGPSPEEWRNRLGEGGNNQF